eukprot:jgi/Bigna1/145197/aug1.96_g19905
MLRVCGPRLDGVLLLLLSLLTLFTTNITLDEWCELQHDLYEGRSGQELAEQVTALHSEKDFDQALPLYRYLLCDFWDNIDVHLNFASALAENRRLKDAVIAYRAAGKVFPDNRELMMRYHNAKNRLEETENPERAQRVGNVDDPTEDRGEKWTDEYEWWRTMQPWFPPNERKIRQLFADVSVPELIQSYEKQHRQALKDLQDKKGDSEALRFVVVGPGSGC